MLLYCCISIRLMLGVGVRCCCNFRCESSRRRHCRWQQELPLRVCSSGPHPWHKGHHQSHLVPTCCSSSSSSSVLDKVTFYLFIYLFVIVHLRFAHFDLLVPIMIHVIALFLLLCSYPGSKITISCVGVRPVTVWRAVSFHLLFPSLFFCYCDITESLPKLSVTSSSFLQLKCDCTIWLLPNDGRTMDMRHVRSKFL